jgi:hypothetical protein
LTVQTGAAYQVYTFSDLKAGETLDITIKGNGAWAAVSAGNTNFTLASLFFLVGLLVIGTGFWWARRSGENNNEDQPGEQESGKDFDRVVDEIARLDHSHENGEMDEQVYRDRREMLRRQAKAILQQTSSEQ